MIIFLSAQVQGEAGNRPRVSDDRLVSSELLDDQIPEIVSPTSMICSQLVTWATGNRREPEAARQPLGFNPSLCRGICQNLSVDSCFPAEPNPRAAVLLKDWLNPVCHCESLATVRMAHAPGPPTVVPICFWGFGGLSCEPPC